MKEYTGVVRRGNVPHNVSTIPSHTHTDTTIVNVSPPPVSWQCS